MNTTAILGLAMELLRFSTNFGIPSAIAFAESLSAKPEPTVDDLVAALQRAHKSADAFLQEARERAERDAVSGAVAAPIPPARKA